MSAVELNQITKRFGKVLAVNEISLSVEAGSLTAILGPSGSGKSTMLSLIAGIDVPDSGTIRIGGIDRTWSNPADRNVGLVFQSYALFPHLNVFENVAFALKIRGVVRSEIERRVGDALARVQLAGFAARKPSQLSGGQQQRVAIARAIVFNPTVLLLDEPLAALDRKLREDLRLELRQLQRSLGITTVLVTHDQDEALSMADRVAIMSDGTIQQIDAPERAYRCPNNRFVAGFLGTANLFEGPLRSDGGGHYIALETGEKAPCAAPAHERSVGVAVCAVLRPEQIRFVSPDARPSMHARVDEMIFCGETARYCVSSAGGQRLFVNLSNPRLSFDIGTTVGLDWDPADVWMMPAAANAREVRAA